MSTPNRKLEAARLKRRWSVEVACKKVGVSVNTFNRWERGLQLPQLETLDQLCKAFEMTPDELGFEHVIRAKRRKQETGPVQAQTRDTFLVEDVTPPTQPPPDITPMEEPVRDEIAFQIEQIKKNLDEIDTSQHESEENSEAVSRRRAVALLVSTPAAVFSITQGTHVPPLSPDEIIALSSVNLPLCWQLYFEGGFTELNNALPGYITQLSALAQKTSYYQKEAAALASQAHQMGYLLALQRQDFGTSLKHTKEAVQYGHIAESVNLQITSLARKAYVYFGLHQHQRRLQIYQEAQQLCQHTCSSLLRGYIYAGLAETYASLKDEETALGYLKKARESYPLNPEDDEVYAYTHFRWPTFHNFAGQVYLHLDKPQQARAEFAIVDKGLPIGEEPYRVELMVYQAATASALGELEQSCALLEKAVKLAGTLGSNLRYDEAYIVYERMQTKWGQESRVQMLGELFH